MPPMTPMTRRDYLFGVYAQDRETVYRAYYGQFVEQYLRDMVTRHIGGVDRLTAAFEADVHFNTIPLQEWDQIASWMILNADNLARHMREMGDYPTTAGMVCVAKEAAQQVVERARKEQA